MAATSRPASNTGSLRTAGVHAGETEDTLKSSEARATVDSWVNLWLDLPNVIFIEVLVALAICGFGNCGFDYSRTLKLQITRENCYFELKLA